MKVDELPLDFRGLAAELIVASDPTDQIIATFTVAIIRIAEFVFLRAAALSRELRLARVVRVHAAGCIAGACATTLTCGCTRPSQRRAGWRRWRRLWRRWRRWRRYGRAFSCYRALLEQLLLRLFAAGLNPLPIEAEGRLLFLLALGLCLISAAGNRARDEATQRGQHRLPPAAAGREPFDELVESEIVHPVTPSLR